MKLEKISDNQIRCILTKEDLTDRNIKLQELSYGSERARNLFYDMMRQANLQFGFETNGVPLMIEAIPMSSSLILNITKVKDPEELDTRFSSFSSPQNTSASETHFTGADGILNLLRKLKEMSMTPAETVPKKNADTKKQNVSPKKTGGKSSNLIEAFRFSSLDDAIRAAKAVNFAADCKNSLYKLDINAYILVLHSSSQEPESFNRVCNILSEYSVSDHCSEASEQYLNEHGYLMIKEEAVQKLSNL